MLFHPLYWWKFARNAFAKFVLLPLSIVPRILGELLDLALVVLAGIVAVVAFIFRASGSK